MQQATRSDARANRARLLDAAREVFAERGFEADIREICQRADVGMGTFYRNFVNKEGLVEALMDEVICQVERTVQLALAEADPLDGIGRLLDKMLAMAEEHRRMIQSLQAAGHAKPEHGHELLMAQVAQLFRRAQDAGSIRDDIPAGFIVQSLQGVFLNYLDLRESWCAEDAQRYSRALFMDALLPRSPA